MTSLRTVSYGGGVQSTALLVLAAQSRIDYRIFLFANVGDDSEHPDTLRYVRDVAMPYAAEHGIDIHELHRIKRDGATETLYGRLTKPGSRSIGIPVRMNGNGAPGKRACTADFKIKVIAKWQREHGATKEVPAVCALGISVDEVHRARSSSGIATQVLTYPLLDLGLRRQDCMNVIADAGLPVPRRSACFFCPFHKLDQWRDMKRDEPELFERSVALEALVNERRAELGKDPVWFTRALRPLPVSVGPGIQEQLPMDGCDGGMCFT